jgi:hypothetical protein
MQFYSLDECPDVSPDIEFKESTTSKRVWVVITGIALAGSLGAAALGIGPAFLDYGIAVVAMLLNALCLSMLRAARRPTGWLMRVSGDRILIKFRSFMNDHFPTDEIQIVEIDRCEVAWVGQAEIEYVNDRLGDRSGKIDIALAENVQWNDHTNSMWKRDERLYLEIGLASGDTTQLAELLRIERNHPAAGRRFKTKTGDYPVLVVAPDFIQVRWLGGSGSITPGLKTALEFFSRWTRVREARKETVDLTFLSLRKLPIDEQNARLRQSAFVNGIGTADTLRKLRGCSLEEAQPQIDAL